jgi:hypothetical protein
MSDPTYEAWRVVRVRCLDDLASIHPSYLRMLVGELRQLADVIAGELARRERPTDQQDARLYKPKGQPQ